MKNIIQFFIIALMLIIASSAYSQGPTLVVTEKVHQQQFYTQIKLIGLTQGIIESNIVAEISGRVESIKTTEGNKIAQGEALLLIDSKPISLSLRAKQAEALQAAVQSELATEQKGRATQLRKDNLISSSGLDSALAWDAIQQAQFQKADAEREQLEIDLANTTIKAPYSGYTGRLLVDVGSWVTPGLPVFEMVDISKIKINADLPEKYFGQLKVGSSVSIKTSSGNNTLQGVVVGVSPAASKSTHTYPVIIEVDNKDEVIASGMLVQVTLSLNEQFTSLSIPKDAIVRQGDNTIVYTIVDGKASMIPVTILSTEGAMLAVQSPMLHVDMEIIMRGNERVYPGAAVTTGQDAPPEEVQSETADEAGE